MAKKEPKVFLLKRSKIKKIIEKHGFNCYVMVEDNKEGDPFMFCNGDPAHFLVKEVTLDWNSDIVQSLFKMANHKNVVEAYFDPTDDKAKKELEESGLFYSEKTKKLKMTPKVKKDFCSWKLAISAEDMALHLFKEGLMVGYYNTEVLTKHCPQEIKELLDDKILKTVRASKIVEDGESEVLPEGDTSRYDA